MLSRSYAAKLGGRVDQNQELGALGAANVAAGLAQGFPISSSSSRTPVAEAAGARTQLAGVVAAIALGVVLVLATGLFESLPLVTLSAIIVAAVLGLIDLPAFRFLRRVDRTEFGLALSAALGVALLGVLPGIGVAVGLSVLNLLWRAWHPYTAVLGRVDGRKGYHDLRRHPDARQVPGLVLYRFDAPLIFANTRTFRDPVRHLAKTEPRPRWIVVAAEPITDVDTTAADILEGLDLRAERRRDQPGVRRAQDPCAPEDQTMSAAEGRRSTQTTSSRRSPRASERPSARRPARNGPKVLAPSHSSSRQLPGVGLRAGAQKDYM